MTASELRELASALNYQSWSEWRTENESKFAQAAQVLELVAWAEEKKVEAVRRRHGYSVHIGLVAHNGDTLLDTLQRAREAIDGRA